MTIGRCATLGWDFTNRLQTHTEAAGQETTYRYDPFGRRIQKSVDPDGAGGSPAVVTWYVWDGDMLLGEYDASGGRDVRYAYAGGFAPVQVAYDNGSGEDVYDVHTDHLDTPRLLTDDTGAVAWQSSHEAYGEAQVTSSLGAGRAFNIPGQYHDAETGLHYNRFRYYDPEIGRYISADPIGQVGDLNVYRYALANPALLADPQGLIPLYKWRTCNAKEKAECIKYCDEVIGRPFVSCRRRVMALRSIGNRTDIRTLGISCNCKDDGGFCQNNPGKCVLGAAMVLGAACAAALAPEVIVIPVLLGTAAAGS